MATLNIIDSKGAQNGTVEVADGLLSLEPNLSAVRQALIAYEANQRAGTHATKTRGFVSGGGRKPWKQKGTGRARQGSTRAPQWRGGAIIFGPQPRSYRQKVNKKVRRLAFCSALSDLNRQGRIHVLSSFGIEKPRTKDFQALLGTIKAGEREKVLVLLSEPNEAIYLSARNLGNVAVDVVGSFNIHDLLSADHLVTTPEALKSLERFAQQ
jgi:large subunit ribosomal protein L4